MKSKEYIPWLFSVLVLFSSCENTYGIETSEGIETAVSVSAGKPSYKPQDQSVLMDGLRDRRQIANMTDYNGVCTISFHDGPTAHILESCFPLVQTYDGLVWSLNGKKTDIPVQMDENGNLHLPELKPGASHWLLDGKEISVPTESYHKFHDKSTTIHLTGLVVFQDRLYVHTSDGTIAAHDIIKDSFYKVPDYWFDHLVEKEREAEAAIEDADGNSCSFVFFTDAHWGRNVKKSPALIRHIHEFTPVTDVLFGGDVITVFYSNPETALKEGLKFQEAFRFLGTDFHCLFGNHDDNSAGSPSNRTLHLSEEQVFSYLQSQMTDVVYGNYYNFYYDKPESKTRIICLDTGRYNLGIFHDHLPETVSFAIEALSSVPADWHIIIASHIWCTSKKQADGTYKQSLMAFANPILRVLDAYNSRMAGVYLYKTRQIPYDFTKAEGRVEFCIGGHTHGNFTTSSEGGIPVVIVISDSFQPPERNTTKEQSVTLVVVDYKNRKLSLSVIGYGTDRIIDL